MGRYGAAAVWRKAAVAFLVSWPPLVALAAAQGRGLDYLAMARYAIAVPLLIVAESFFAPLLWRVFREFDESGLLAEGDRARIGSLAETLSRVVNGIWMDVALIVLAYVLTFTTNVVPQAPGRVTWDSPIVDGRPHISLAGWWRLFVSQPLFLVIVLRTLARLGAWTYGLLRLARMPLRLIPMHVDRVGGLAFLPASLYGFLPVAFTLGVLMAARVADGVLRNGQSPWSFRYHIIVTVIGVLVLFAGPLLVFQPKLWRLRVTSLFEVGDLSTRAGRRVESLAGRSEPGGEIAPTAEIATTSHLIGIVSHIPRSRLFLLESSDVAILAITVLLPFVPLLFMFVPIDDILAFIGKTVL